jgi:hypothetical protein
MVQNPSWEANWFAASQEILRISRNPKVHHRTHKRPPPVSILGQPNPVHIPTSHLLQIHSNIIHPSTPRSPQWSLLLRFPHQDPIHSPLLTHTRYMPSPSHSMLHHPYINSFVRCNVRSGFERNLDQFGTSCLTLDHRLNAELLPNLHVAIHAVVTKLISKFSVTVIKISS